MQPTQQKYTDTEKVLLAIILCLKEYELILYGAREIEVFIPTTWGLILTQMMQVMRQCNHEVFISSALTKELINMVCFAFVNSTDLPETLEDPNATEEDLIAPFQAALDSWAGTLCTTGGELYPIKLFAHIIDYQWTGDD